jgi:hypothetical protein
LFQLNLIFSVIVYDEDYHKCKWTPGTVYKEGLYLLVQAVNGSRI